MDAQNIILSPHFDDAVLSLGGFLARHGARTTVATIFAGTPTKTTTTAWDTLAGFANSDEAMQTRAEENRRALCSLNVSTSRTKNYRYIDAQYRTQAEGLSVRESDLVEKITRDCAALVRQTVGTCVNVFGPGLALQPDHDLLKQALLQTWMSFRSGDVNFYVYQDLPYACHLIGPQHDLTLLETHMMRGLSAQRHVIRLTRGQMAKKMASLRFYSSQLLALGDALPLIENVAALQARLLNARSRYCEVVYRLTKNTCEA